MQQNVKGRTISKEHVTYNRKEHVVITTYYTLIVCYLYSLCLFEYIIVH